MSEFKNLNKRLESSLYQPQNVCCCVWPYEKNQYSPNPKDSFGCEISVCIFMDE